MCLSVLPVQAEIQTETPNGLWLSISEVQQLPMSGPAWDNVKKYADASLGSADIKNQDTKHNIKTMAVALVYARLAGEVELSVSDGYRKKTAEAIMATIGTE